MIEGWDDDFDERLTDRKTRTGQISYFIPVVCQGRSVAVLATGSTAADKQEMLSRIEAMGPLREQVAIALARLFDEVRGNRDALLRVNDGSSRRSPKDAGSARKSPS